MKVVAPFSVIRSLVPVLCQFFEQAAAFSPATIRLGRAGRYTKSSSRTLKKKDLASRGVFSVLVFFFNEANKFPSFHFQGFGYLENHFERWAHLAAFKAADMRMRIHIKAFRKSLLRKSFLAPFVAKHSAKILQGVHILFLFGGRIQRLFHGRKNFGRRDFQRFGKQKKRFHPDAGLPLLENTTGE